MRFSNLLYGVVVAPLFVVAQPFQVQSDACTLLKPGQVAALLGEAATATPSAGACIWKDATGKRKLTAARLRAAGPAATMAYAGARQSASEGGPAAVTDEPGIGEKAFSSLQSFGVVLVILKQGHLLELQYWTGAAGTPQDQAALRPVAKLASAAF